MTNKLLISTSIISIMCCLSAHAAERVLTVVADETKELTAQVYENNNTSTGATDTLRPGYGSVALVEKGTLNIASGAEMINNTAQHGGAIVNNGGTMETGKILFQGNTATGYAGAIYNTGMANIGANSAFSNNSAQNAGALFNSKTLNVGNDAIFSGNTASNYGGGIYNNKGTITVANNAVFSNNTAVAGGTMYLNGGTVATGSNATFSGNKATKSGGAVYSYGTALEIGDNATFAENTAASGGALYLNGGTAVIGSNATFAGNTSTKSGGAVYFYDGNATIGDNATFTDNKATNGAGLYVNGLKADLGLNNATFKNNMASGNNGGAIWLGTYDITKRMTITNSVFEGNSAIKDGETLFAGAIYLNNGQLIIKDTSFTGNKADVAGALATSTGETNGVFASLDNVTFQDNEASGYGAVANFASNVAYENGGMFIKNSRFINNRATAPVDEGNAGALFLGSSSVTELDNVIFDGNSSAAEGGAIGVRPAPGKGNVGSIKIANSTFSNNTAATTGGAFDNYFSNVVIENTTFKGNTAAEGGAIYNHADADNYGKVGTLNLGGKVTFEGNTANGALNDIYNPSVIKVAENTELTLDGGISGETGTTEFANGTVLNVKQNVTTIENAVTSDGTILNITLARGEKTLDLDDIFTHADNEDSLQNFHINQKNVLYTLVQNADSVSVYDIVLNSDSEVASSLDITKSAAGALLATVASDETTDNAAFNAISHALHERAQSGDKSVAREAEKIGANASTLVQSRETMHSNMMFAAATDELNSPAATSGHTVGTWVRGLFNYASQDDTSKAAGFDANTYGVVAGLGTQLGTHVKAGVAYAYSQTDAKGHGRDTDIASNTLMAYGQYKAENWYTNAMLAYSMSDYTESKSILGYDADADYDVNTLALQSMTGLAYKLGKYDLNPEAGLRYMHIARDGYTDDLGSKIKSQDSDFLTLVAGTKLARDFQFKNEMTLRPELRAAVTYDAISANNNSDVVLTNGVGYTARGESLERLGFEAGARVAFAVSGHLEFSAGYEGKFRKNYQEHAALLNATYKF